MTDSLPSQPAEHLHNPEIQHIIDQVGVATATLYPDWYPGDVPEGQQPTSSKIRGDLALQSVNAATSQGFKMVVVDGGSSPAFLEALSQTSALVEPQEHEGMSIGRQQAFERVSGLDGVGVICWVEPEKVSLVTDGIVDPAKAIIDYRADLIIPERDQAAFDSYPEYQTKFEQESNHLFNGILKRHGLRRPEDEDLDAWFGPRFFRNTPELLNIFKSRYEYKTEVQSGLRQDSTDLWPNALFLPIIATLKAGYRVGSVPVQYRHPAEQTALEQNSPAFEAKRAEQQKNILYAAIHFIRALEEDRSARMQVAPPTGPNFLKCYPINYVISDCKYSP